MQFLSREDGGRKSAIASDYRPNCWFGEYRDGHRLDHDVFSTSLKEAMRSGPRNSVGGARWARPRGRVPLLAASLRRIVSIGMEFEVCEGARVVAHAAIEDIIDSGPEYDIV